MAKKEPVSKNNTDSGRLEPKLTIIKNKNPDVYEWVQSLSRGKLTKFIYEVFEHYAKSGYLKPDAWQHPPEFYSDKPIHESSLSNESLDMIKSQLEMQNKLLLELLNKSDNLTLNQSHIMRSLMQMSMPMFAPNQNLGNGMHHMQSNNFGHSNNTDDLQNQNNSPIKPSDTNVSLDQNDVSTSDDDFIVVLDDAPSNPTVNTDTEEVKPIGLSGGFLVY